MLEIGAFEAKNKLGALLDRVQHGEEIIIHPARQARSTACPEHRADRQASGTRRCRPHPNAGADSKGRFRLGDRKSRSG